MASLNVGLFLDSDSSNSFNNPGSLAPILTIIYKGFGQKNTSDQKKCTK